MDIINKFNSDLYQARLHFDLRHNRLNSDNWEKLIAECTGSRWVKGSKHLADAYNSNLRQCISVKTRKMDPERRKRVKSRDFFDHPEYFHRGGEEFKEGDLDNLHTVSRRCSIPGLDEQTSPAQDIGLAAIADYNSFENDSLKRFNCDTTMDVVIVHGESADGKSYLSRVMFFNHYLNVIQSWEDVPHGPGSKYSGKRAMIIGHDDNGPHLGRIGNLGRQQTCMLRFYRKEEALEILEFRTPMPKQEKFDLLTEQKIMARIIR